jgi:hypothetical protein
MARVTIKEAKAFYSKFKTKNNTDLKVSSKSWNSKINDKKYNLSQVLNSSYPITNIDDIKPSVELNSLLPFRIRITNIGIEGYGPDNPAPIGIAIIGVNNYIL